jgi:hypothetical protein
MTLSREQIAAASDLATETVEVPEWGGTVIVREVTSEQLDAYQAAFMKGNGMAPNARALLVVKALVDEKGERLFSDADVKVLGKKSSKVVERLWDVVARLSGMTKEEEKEAEETFDEAQAGGSDSASPSPWASPNPGSEESQPPSSPSGQPTNGSMAPSFSTNAST